MYQVEIPPAAKKVRELFYCAHMIHSHIAHFFALAAPDFVVGPDADPAERNVVGLIQKVGLDLGKEVIKQRAYAQQVQEKIGGKATHPVCALPGGVSKAITEDDRRDFEEKAKGFVEFARTSLKIFEEVVLANQRYLDLILGPAYTIKTYYMGLVDADNRLNFYDGQVRVVDPEGKEVARFGPSEYLDYIAERVETWTYLKFPFLKKIGWKGLVDGPESGIYRVGPLGRVNAAEGMATPLAQEEYQKMMARLGGRPVHYTLAMHWARLVELLYAAERLLELSRDPEICDPRVRVVPTATPREGVGIVEAPRGTLIHHYVTDEAGIVRKVNLIVATIHNYPAMSVSIREAAKAMIRDGKVSQGLLNLVEMAFRAYDPCFACATHSLVGEMPLEVTVYAHSGQVVDQIVRK